MTPTGAASSGCAITVAGSGRRRGFNQMAGGLRGLSSRSGSGLILPWNTQYPSGCRAHKMHLPTGSTLDRVIRVLVVLRKAFGQPSLNRTAGVRAIEEECTHFRTV